MAVTREGMTENLLPDKNMDVYIFGMEVDDA
jgi:hypothetical protein